MTGVRTPLLFLIFLQLCFSLTADAGASITLSGTVRDAKSGEPLPGANVVFTGTGLGAATDASGRYALRGISAGDERGTHDAFSCKRNIALKNNLR